MEVIRKVFLVLMVFALVSFVGGLASADSDAKININTATVDELTVLRGIGEKKAEAIVEHREKAGLFNTIEDLNNVKGIGGKIFNKIKDLIVVE